MQAVRTPPSGRSAHVAQSFMAAAAPPRRVRALPPPGKAFWPHAGPCSAGVHQKRTLRCVWAAAQPMGAAGAEAHLADDGAQDVLLTEQLPCGQLTVRCAQ
jgi:hypothetical protein